MPTILFMRINAINEITAGSEQGNAFKQSGLKQGFRMGWRCSYSKAMATRKNCCL